jgi:hypothetical protein
MKEAIANTLENGKDHCQHSRNYVEEVITNTMENEGRYSQSQHSERWRRLLPTLFLQVTY